MAAGLLIDGDPRRKPGDLVRAYREVGGAGNREISAKRRIDVLVQLQVKGCRLHYQLWLRQNLQCSVRYDLKQDVGEVGVEVGEITGLQSIRVFADGGRCQIGDAGERDGGHRVEVFPARHLDDEPGDGLLIAVIIASLRRTGYPDNHRRVADDPDDGGGDEVGVPFGGRLDVGDEAADPEQLRRRRGPGAVRRGRIRERRPGERRGKRVGIDRAAGAVVAVIGVGAGKPSGRDERRDRRRQDGEAPVRDNPEDDVGEVRVKIGELVRRKPI